MVLQERVLLRPVGDDDLVPLVVQDVAEVVGPRAGDPVRVGGGGAIARAAAEAVDDRDAEQAGDLDAVDERLGVFGGDGLVRVKGVAVAGNRGDGQAAIFDLLEERVAGFLAGEEGLDVEVGRSGVGTGAKFDGLDAFCLYDVESFVERLIAEQCRKNADLHASASATVR